MTREKKARKKKEERVQKIIHDSTQMNIPIKDVYRGIVVTGLNENSTSDSGYVKMLEVKPQPFLLKKTGEQDRISESFAALLKVAPDKLHIKSMSVPSDLSYQIAEVEKCVSEEKNEQCRNMGVEYIQRLNFAQQHGVSRRFFISFPYIEKQSGLVSRSLDDIALSLNNDANRMAVALANCGNEVIREYQDPDKDILKALYMVYNRDSYLIQPYGKRENEIKRRYLEAMGDNYFYIPARDYIAPSRISYTSKKYLVINNTYYAFLYFPSNGYAPVQYAGWLLRFITAFPGVDVDVFLKKQPK